ncbi:hypothetical protein Clacol_007244 [Clathrus columnatus]|uniref:Cytochrome P450 n=1 Tax=Clathrus columnatus TaxID=1419009 RepID=A0AAV5AJF2_9AGAM|nr:hypothetical protein Clacol_007244 [Clathrus columnatus]
MIELDLPPSPSSPVNSWFRNAPLAAGFGQSLQTDSSQQQPPSLSSTFSIIMRILALAIVPVGWWILHLIRLRRKNAQMPPLPPGPKPLPVLGNLLDLPVERDYETYTRWKDVYGDVIYLSALGNDIVVLNSVQAASDLLDKRSLWYSDRPYIPMIHEDSLMGFNWTLIFMNYSPAWRQQRRLFAKHIPNSAYASSGYTFRVRQISSAHNLLRQLLRTSTPPASDDSKSSTSLSTSDPYSYRSHMRFVFGNVLLGVAYGYDVQPEDDPHIDLFERGVQLVNVGINPGTFLVNVFPILKHIPAWMPFNYAKAHGKLVRQTHRELKERPMEILRAKLASGTAAPSFATNALMDIYTERAEALAKSKVAGQISEKSNSDNGHVISETDVKHIAASMYGAGFDTTFAPLLFATLHLLLNPSIQQRAHAELDTVLGSPNSNTFRLPTWEDRPHLPYIDAILKESLSASNTSPSEATPTKEYDTYRNFRIPRGSMIIPNLWAMLRDPEVYHDPEAFKPERFLREEYTDEAGNVRVLREAEPHPSVNGLFGFGRRACPGQYLADSIIWVELVNLLACFKFVPALDGNGKPIDVSWAKTPLPAFVLHPPAFPCLFEPRSDIVAQRIMETEA